MKNILQPLILLLSWIILLHIHQATAQELPPTNKTSLFISHPSNSPNQTPTTPTATPNTDEIWNIKKTLANTLTDNAHWDKANIYYDELSPNSQDFNFLINHAFTLYHIAKIPQAIKLTDKVLQIKPDSPRALFLMGLLYIDDNKPDKAKTYITEGLKYRPADPDANLALAQIAITENDYQHAIEILTKLYNQRPFFVPVLQRLALCYEKINDLPNAEKFLTETLDSHNNKQLALIALLNFYKRTNQKEKITSTEKKLLDWQKTNLPHKNIRPLQPSSK